MNKNLRTAALASAIFATMAFWSAPGFPASRLDDTPGPAVVELADLADFSEALREAIRVEQRRMEGGCDVGMAVEGFARVEAEAIRAVRQLGKLWREGRLRAGGLAMTEVLLGELGELIDEADRGASVARSLALLQQQALDGAPDSSARVARTVEIHPAPSVCLTGALDEADLARADEGAEISIELTVHPAR